MEQNSPQRREENIFGDIIGSKLEIKKVLRTFVQLFKDPKAVVDDFYRHVGRYTRPFKYTLFIVGPYVTALQLFDLDVADFLVNKSRPDMDGLDESALRFTERYLELTARWAKIQFEFLPVYYAGVYAPVLGFWLKKFFKKPDYSFAYYYGSALYLTITITLFSIALFLLAYLEWASFSLTTRLSTILVVGFVTYGLARIFEGNLAPTIFKSLLSMVLAFVCIVAVTTIVLMGLTLATM